MKYLFLILMLTISSAPLLGQKQQPPENSKVFSVRETVKNGKVLYKSSYRMEVDVIYSYGKKALVLTGEDSKEPTFLFIDEERTQLGSMFEEMPEGMEMYSVFVKKLDTHFFNLLYNNNQLFSLQMIEKETLISTAFSNFK